MKTFYQKPRICIALPGLHYLSHTTYVLNTKPLLTYLAEDFDVTLVFRKTLEIPDQDIRYLTILDPANFSAKEAKNTDPYFVPPDLFRAGKYLKVLNAFAKEHAHKFDLVIERQWSLVGSLASAFSHYGVPSVFVVEAEFYTNSNSRNLLKKILKFSLNRILPYLRRRWIQRANSIIVETEQTKSFLQEKGYLNSKKPVYPIPNGVDPNIFFPQDRRVCREQLGIEQDCLMLTYVGSLRGFIQDLEPIIEALGREKPKNVVLHLIGDGTNKEHLESLARRFDAPVTCHGRLLQQEAARYIGAADICIAPYNKHLFPEEKFTCASLKVCEYLACGRPVLTIPCERMAHLLDNGKYGFLVENQVENYRKFFRNLSSRPKIHQLEKLIISDLENSVLKKKNIVLTWREVAKMYKQVILDNLPKEQFSKTNLWLPPITALFSSQTKNTMLY